MRSRTSITLSLLGAIVLAGVLATAWTAGSASTEAGASVVQSLDEPAPITEDRQQSVGSPITRDSSVPLASGTLRTAVERIGRGEAVGSEVDLVEDRVRVEVLHSLTAVEVHTIVASVDGIVEGAIEGLVQALVPVDRLVELEAAAGIRYLRPPLEANVPLPLVPDGAAPIVLGASVVGQEVSKTNADAWHAAGFDGAGVKIGIIDGFDGALWDAAQAAGELPEPAGTFCQISGSTCVVWDIGVSHGEGVAEIVYEMAPGAELYLATAFTVADTQAAVDYFSDQGVDVISRSQTGAYDGPGDGTGPIASVIDNAVAAGMVWFNSAGNSASDGSFFGQYWRGQWADANSNNQLEFAPGDERLGFGCGFVNGIRWNDFASANPTDYDVAVYDDVNDIVPIYVSVNDQTLGFEPIEMLDFPCEQDEVYFLSIVLFSAGNGTAGDTLEFMTNGGAIEYWQNPYSASGLASDSANAGALSIGAIDPPNGTNIAPYSSQGPTNDGRIKPDISAASCVASFTFSPDCFNGTSAAAPAAAGAAALVIDAGVASTPAQVKTYLLGQASTDRGAPGSDNIYGAGELILPAPPGVSPPTATPSAATATPTPTRTPTPFPTTFPGELGDLDCDGFINSIDALLILQFKAFIHVSACPWNGNIDNNDTVDSIDAALLLQFIAGLISTLPP